MAVLSDLQSFKRLLEQKIVLLKEIRELTSKQPAFILSEDTDALLDNIQKRQLLLDKLEKIQGAVPDAQLIRNDAECAAMAAEAQCLLADIQAQDKQNEAAALDRMNQLRENLKKTQTSRTVLRGYEGTQTGSGATYFDKLK